MSLGVCLRVCESVYETGRLSGESGRLSEESRRLPGESMNLSGESVNLSGESLSLSGQCVMGAVAEIWVKLLYFLVFFLLAKNYP